MQRRCGCENLNGFIVHTCENSDIKIVLPEDVKITFMQDHTAEGMCPSCRYVTDSYEVDGLDVYMENVPEGIVNQVLEFLDNGIPDKMKDTCRKLTFTQNLGKYNAKYGGEQWGGFAMYPSGNAYVRVKLAGDRLLDNSDIEIDFLMMEQAIVICSTIAHELGHCYDTNFTTNYRYSNSTEWKRLCEEEGDVYIEQLEENYATNEYNREMFARSMEAYFLKEYFEIDVIPNINCVGMIDYVSSLLEDAA